MIGEPEPGPYGIPPQQPIPDPENPGGWMGHSDAYRALVAKRQFEQDIEQAMATGVVPDGPPGVDWHLEMERVRARKRGIANAEATEFCSFHDAITAERGEARVAGGPLDKTLKEYAALGRDAPPELRLLVLAEECADKDALRRLEVYLERRPEERPMIDAFADAARHAAERLYPKDPRRVVEAIRLARNQVETIAGPGADPVLILAAEQVSLCRLALRAGERAAREGGPDAQRALLSLEKRLSQAIKTLELAQRVAPRRSHATDSAGSAAHAARG